MAAPPADDLRLVLTGEVMPRSGIPHARYLVRLPRGFCGCCCPRDRQRRCRRCRAACSGLAASRRRLCHPSPRPLPTPSLCSRFYGAPATLFFCPPLQEDIGAHLAAFKVPVQAVLGALQTMHSKYKLMETSLVENRKSLRARIPGIQASLDAVKLLVARAAEGGAPFATYFQVADQVHAKASVAPSGRVCLWLGANVMLEYSYAEAEELLTANLAAATGKEAEQQGDLDFVREQVVMVEVNMARAFNWDVEEQRKAKRLDAAAEGRA